MKAKKNDFTSYSERYLKDQMRKGEISKKQYEDEVKKLKQQYPHKYSDIV